MISAVIAYTPVVFVLFGPICQRRAGLACHTHGYHYQSDRWILSTVLDHVHGNILPAFPAPLPMQITHSTGAYDVHRFHPMGLCGMKTRLVRIMPA
jgi:hypothetical protein